uniref:BPTI/Kunitz inhibitor domain-containing protein n=1 Tax=Meloidogyne enterolobii TaxID=390850 RepID=A0A6V7XG57_MELEN|nr:unnamed protein product [Meloidogyne enterolobii]
MRFAAASPYFAARRFLCKRAMTAVSGSCYLPKSVGNCRGSFQRWWYDNGYCKSFIYGGCGGNANRFYSYAECQRACRVSFL